MDQDNWQVVVDRNPKGYVEINDSKYLVCGRVDRVEINRNEVQIYVKWAARRAIQQFNLPTGKWEILSRVPAVLLAFPNEVIPFVIEPTPHKGDRVRFLTASIMYFDEAEDDLTLERVEAQMAASAKSS